MSKVQLNNKGYEITHTFLFYGSQRTGKIVAYIKKAVLVTKSDSWHSKSFQQKPSAKRERHGCIFAFLPIFCLKDKNKF